MKRETPRTTLMASTTQTEFYLLRRLYRKIGLKGVLVVLVDRSHIAIVDLVTPPEQPTWKLALSAPHSHPLATTFVAVFLLVEPLLQRLH